MSFRIGQKVRCIQTWHRNGLGNGTEIGPVKGGEYVIRAIGFLNLSCPGLCVLLEEIVNRPDFYECGFSEAAFGAWRFRPIIERKTDISCLTALLHPSPAEVKTRVIADKLEEILDGAI